MIIFKCLLRMIVRIIAHSPNEVLIAAGIIILLIIIASIIE